MAGSRPLSRLDADLVAVLSDADKLRRVELEAIGTQIISRFSRGPVRLIRKISDVLEWNSHLGIGF
jgi:hypothetical protein